MFFAGELEAMAGAMQAPKSSERRTSLRFPIKREVRYRVLGRSDEHSGVGTTINISSNAVLFTTLSPLPRGRRVELTISWPTRLDHGCDLKLVIRGHIIRQEKGRAVVEIQQYEFRTSKRSELRQPAVA